MKLPEFQLPSNKKFGIFFSAIFLGIFVYFFTVKNTFLSYIFISISLGFAVISLLKADLLAPLNKFWMYIGIILGIIISPIILGMIFFCLVTPMALIMRLFGRDELNLNPQNKNSLWIDREEDLPNDSFTQQF